jgi:hypothetical protein
VALGSRLPRRRGCGRAAGARELDHALQRRRAGWPHGDEWEPVVRDVRGEPVDELRVADVGIDALRGRQPLLVLGVPVDGAPRAALVPPLDTPHEIGHLVADQCDLLDRIRLGDLGERRRRFWVWISTCMRFLPRFGSRTRCKRKGGPGGSIGSRMTNAPPDPDRLYPRASHQKPASPSGSTQSRTT